MRATLTDSKGRALCLAYRDKGTGKGWQRCGRLGKHLAQWVDASGQSHKAPLCAHCLSANRATEIEHSPKGYRVSTGAAGPMIYREYIRIS